MGKINHFKIDQNTGKNTPLYSTEGADENEDCGSKHKNIRARAAKLSSLPVVPIV